MIKTTKLWTMSVQPARWGQNKVIKIAHKVSANDRPALRMGTKRGDQDHEVVANERQTTRWRQNEVIKTTKL